MWLRRRRKPETEDPALRAAEAHVEDLKDRADQVVEVLAPRHERNHWAEAVEELWQGGRTA